MLACSQRKHIKVARSKAGGLILHDTSARSTKCTWDSRYMTYMQQPGDWYMTCCANRLQFAELRGFPVIPEVILTDS